MATDAAGLMSADVFTHDFVMSAVPEAQCEVLAPGPPAGSDGGSVTEAAIFSAIDTDTRRVRAGSLFVALKGERFDANDFVTQALEAGAAGCVCSLDAQVPPGALGILYRVKDTLDAFTRLAAAHRRRFDIPVIGVAGSAGKTTSKEMLSAILSGRYSAVLRTQGSQNGFVGIPLTLCALQRSHDAAVVEIGIDEPGAMATHLGTVAPTGVLLTCIAPEHLEKLGSLEQVAVEELKSLQHAAAVGGVFAVNLDDPLIAAGASSLHGAGRTEFSLVPIEGEAEALNSLGLADLTTRLVGRLSSDGATLVLLGDRSFELSMPLPGEHNARNLLGAVAMALKLGLSPEEIRSGLKRFSGADGRTEIRSSPKGGTAICDWYNANPASMEAALRLASVNAAKRSGGKLWVCLGDMLELGSEEERWHRELSRAVMASGADPVLLYGPRMRWLEAELRGGGFSGELFHSESHFSLAARISEGLGPEDTLLLKGSRGMRMEEVWAQLKA